MRLETLFIILALVLVAACTPQTPPADQTQDLPDEPMPKPAEIGLCEQAGGTWTQLPNTCVDACQYVRAPQPVMCGQALTMGCDCGPEQCWTGTACEPN